MRGDLNQLTPRTFFFFFLVIFHLLSHLYVPKGYFIILQVYLKQRIEGINHCGDVFNKTVYSCLD